MINLDAGLTGAIVDLFCLPKKQQPCDRKCYVRRSNPNLRMTSFIALYLSDDNSQGQKVQVMANYLRQTAFLNAPESDRITPKSSEDSAV